MLRRPRPILNVASIGSCNKCASSVRVIWLASWLANDIYMQFNSTFRPAFWLRNPHAQTILAAKLRPQPKLLTSRERLELADGDFLDLAWLPEHGLTADAPLVLVLHGLNGSLESNYVRGLLRAVAAGNGRGLMLHFRGSAKPNRLPNSYHSGETG